MPKISSEDYESFVREAQAPMSVDNSIAWAMGLAGESGEVCEMIKKGCIRMPGEIGYRPIDRDELARELGDVQFYLTSLALEYGIGTDEIRMKNIEKLTARGRLGKTNGR